MKFLVDQQLPPALVAFIHSQGHQAQHVRELGMKESDDRTIWRHAAANQMIMVSKDEDFYFLATTPGNTVKLLWVRIGNCRTKTLIESLSVQFSRIIVAFESGSFIVEIQ